jgi:hypothetical protein
VIPQAGEQTLAIAESEFLLSPAHRIAETSIKHWNGQCVVRQSDGASSGCDRGSSPVLA